MKTKVYNLSGKEVSDIELSDKIFNIKINSEMVHQVYVQQMNNQREPWADTKSKGEVRGGGKKPWQQKGTGRARHGSIRSPIWKGGGVAFGPLTDRNYKTKINKKTNRLAIKMCFTDKAQEGNLLVLENLNFSDAKTKLFASMLKAIPAKTNKFLILTAEKDVAVMRMIKNLKNVDVLMAKDSNVLSLLRKSTVVTTVDGVKKIEAVFSK